MGYNYPWTDYHELNLDWLIDEVMKIKNGDWTPTNFQIANVRDYGAVGDGATDDTAAFIDAIDSGLPVYVPAGQYLITNVLTLSRAGMFGVGVNSEIDLYGLANITATAWYSQLRGLLINTTDKTSGYAVQVTGAYSRIQNVRVYGTSAANGIYIDGPSSAIINCQVENAARGITVAGNDTSINITNCIIRKAPGVPQTGTGIYVESGNAALTINECSVLLYTNAVYLEDNAYSTRIADSWLDTVDKGVYCAGRVNDLRILDTWISATTVCVDLATAQGCSINNCVLWSTKASTVGIGARTQVAAMSVEGSEICTAYGINIDTAQVRNLIITGCHFGVYRGWSDLGHAAVWLNAPTNANILIAGNDLTGYASQLAGSLVGVTAVNNLT